jgi:hypothetical protein
MTVVSLDRAYLAGLTSLRYADFNQCGRTIADQLPALKRIQHRVRSVTFPWSLPWSLRPS